MQVTNRYGMHPLYHAMAQASVVGWRPDPLAPHISQLCGDSPRIFALGYVHWDEIEVDCRDLYPSLLGTAWHAAMFEEADQTAAGALAEQRHKATLPNGVTVVGRPDFLERIGGDIQACTDVYRLTDWKHDSFAACNGGLKDSHRLQARAYVWLCAQHGINVTEAIVCHFATDWYLGRAKRGAQGYPATPQTAFNVPLPAVGIGLEEELAAIEEWLTVRSTEYHAACRDYAAPGGSLPPLCTEAERWADKGCWQVKSKSRKRSLKNCASYEEAEEYRDGYLRENGSVNATSVTIEQKPGEDTRCVYCHVAPFCDYAIEQGYVEGAGR